MKKNISEKEFLERLEGMRKRYLERLNVSEEVQKNLEYKEKFYERFASAEAKKARIKRRAAQLEFKRCQRKLDNKSCTDLDEKLAVQKALFKQKYKNIYRGFTKTREK
ncbi:hypothetical protein OZX68_06110 [Streptococcaceae bacterium ESL0729]|nr:hypothetical protein OZX68_06110 [Streptococcaceae bacterium ESL0729]